MTDNSVEKFAAASVLADEICERMITRLEWIHLRPKVILDAGCGIGTSTAMLKKHYADTHILAVDAALPLLKYAQHQSQTMEWINAYSDHLPLPDHSVDLIFSNLLLPWTTDITKIMLEWRRVLRPNGLLMFTTFGPDTLKEWTGPKAVNLIDMHNIGDSLVQSGWLDPVLDVEYIEMVFREERRLIEELQITGMIAHEPARMQPPEESEKTYPITYEIVYGHAWNSNLSIGYIADQEGVAKIPLSHLRKRKR